MFKHAIRGFKPVAAAVPLVIVLAIAGCGGKQAAPRAGSAGKVKSDQTALQVIEALPDASTFKSLIDQAGLAGKLSGPGKITVLVPDNDAFNLLMSDRLAALKNPANKQYLTDQLKYHMIDGQTLVADMIKAAVKHRSIKTIEGGSLRFTLVGRRVTISDATDQQAGLYASDIAASNGVVDVIDRVLLNKR